MTGPVNELVSHLEGAIDGYRLAPGQLYSLHQGRPIWVRYDLAAMAARVDRDAFASREASLWRYRECLPLGADIQPVTLGEGMTPLLDCKRLGERLGLADFWIKDESQMPTGSFKDRGQSVAISMARSLGVNRVAIPTAGNAGGSMAAYAARAGLEAFVFMPEDTPPINRFEVTHAGGHGWLVNGLITDCGKIVRDGIVPMNWFDMSTLKEPYRLEGKKTMGLELAEQFGWVLPDVILYPTGGGTGLIGMWKAFSELIELGWLEATDLPRMVAVQSEGCCPIVRAYDNGERFAVAFEDADTIASGIRVPAAVGDFMILDAIAESGGCAVAVDETAIRDWMQEAAMTEGIALGPESACCIGAARKLRESGWLEADARTVVFNCGGARKYPHLMACELPALDRHARIDWANLAPPPQ